MNDGSPDRTSEVTMATVYLSLGDRVSLVSWQEAMKFVSQYGVDKVRLLEFVKNRGKGGAVRMVSAPLLRTPSGLLTSILCRPSPFPQGTLSARGERILMVDADGATEIADLVRLEEAMDEITKDFVSCWRVETGQY